MMCLRLVRAVAAILPALLVSLTARVTFAGGTPLGTAITYQGELKVGGTPATGTHHLRFQLWDALAGGAQIGSDVNWPAVAMSDGRFTVPLDFGGVAFDGSARWLQVQVITNGGATVTSMVPRQPITAAPYALQTRGITVNDAGQVGIGTTNPQFDLHVHHPGSSTGDITFGSPLAQCAIAAFANNGHRRDIRFTDDGLALCVGQTSASPPTLDGLFIEEAFGNVGIGTMPTTSVKLEVVASGSNAIMAVIPNPGLGSGTAVFGEVVDSGDATWYAGRFINHQSTSGARNYGVFGSAAGSSGVGAYGENESQGGTGVNGYAPGLFGIGASAWGGAYDFDAQGPGVNFGATSSIRWKRNIEAIADPLVMLANLRGVMFDWDDEHGGQHDVGMIAEEVGKVLPEIVVYEANGIDANGMDYSKLTPLLVEAVKALRAEKDAEIEALRERIEMQDAAVQSQQEEIAGLLRRIERLERTESQ